MVPTSRGYHSYLALFVIMQFPGSVPCAGSVGLSSCCNLFSGLLNLSLLRCVVLPDEAFYNSFKAKIYTLKFTSLSLNSLLTMCSLVSNGPDENNGNTSCFPSFFLPVTQWKVWKCQYLISWVHTKSKSAPYCVRPCGSEEFHLPLFCLPLYKGGEKNTRQGEKRNERIKG